MKEAQDKSAKWTVSAVCGQCVFSEWSVSGQ